MNAEISETIKATVLGLGMQIPEIPAQHKFVSAGYHAHSNAHKTPKGPLKIQDCPRWGRGGSGGQEVL